jgi:tRNA pseudouridine65 synthase
MVADPQLIHLDDRILVMNKPSGLAVHPGWTPKSEPTALQWARREARRWVYPVHRLDRATSGVLVFALDSEAAGALGRAFEQGRVRKLYLALVRGVPPQTGTIDNPVPRSEGGERVPASTEFRLVARSERDRCSLVEAKPKTGRLHQIRRHLKHISHPIVGDVRYGKGDINRHYRSAWSLHRLALHALAIELPDPVTNDLVRFEAPISEDLAGPLRALGVVPEG